MPHTRPNRNPGRLVHSTLESVARWPEIVQSTDGATTALASMAPVAVVILAVAECVLAPCGSAVTAVFKMLRGDPVSASAIDCAPPMFAA